MTHETVSIAAGALRAAIDLAGAELQSLTVRGREFFWQRDATFWPHSAPVLFPFVGALRENRARAAQGEVRAGRHGIARISDFYIVSRSTRHVTLGLSSNDETRTYYPYDFRLEVSFGIDGDVLEQCYTVTNIGTAPLPFAIGAHPAFNVPVVGTVGERFEDYQLVFSRPWSCVSPVLDKSCGLLDYDRSLPLLDGAAILPLTHELFDKSTLVLRNVPDHTVSLVGPSGCGMRIDFADFDYLGVWSAPGAPFVALEPWTGTATRSDEDDVFEHKQGVMLLAPGCSDMRAFRMRPIVS